MSDLLNVIAFIKVGREQKAQPRSVGYAAQKGDKCYVTLQMLPTPGSGWDGVTLVIEPKREEGARPTAPDERDDRSSSKTGWGKATERGPR
jgi:hypothetical protein